MKRSPLVAAVTTGIFDLLTKREAIPSRTPLATDAPRAADASPVRTP